RVVGIVLMVFAAGLLADAVQNMQKLGWLPFLDHAIWNTSSYLSESSSIGDVFHSLLGYAERPTVLQAIVWVTYLGVATTAFVVMGRRGRTAAPAVPTVPAETSAVPPAGETTAGPAPVSTPSASAPTLASPPRA
ncbi:MAG TPA: FTR1 family protein, partial [Acidimicrobiales bacterium]